MSRHDPTQETNLTVVRTLMEDVLHGGRMTLLPTLVAPEYVGHLPIGDHYGPEGVRIEFTAYRTAIPGLIVTLDDLFATDDRVARRFTLRGASCSPAPARNTPIPVSLRGIAIDRLADGLLVESWVQIDRFGSTL
jgi:hypothetical protein